MNAIFPGSYLPKIVVQGANKTEIVAVKEIPAEQADAHLQKLATAG